MQGPLACKDKVQGNRQMQNWFMLTLVGVDRPGIVAGITQVLFQGGANLGEATMARLGGNFSIMLMVQYPGELQGLSELVRPAAQALGLQLHVDVIEGHLHRHLIPDVRVTVYGADRAGMVAQVSCALTDAGFNILDLQSDVGGSEAKPFYIMTMEGVAEQGMEAVQQAVQGVRRDGIEVDVQAIETLIG